MEETSKKVSPAQFVREVRQETARVVWPTRKETLISSAMVLVMVAIASVFFLVADGAISFVIRFILQLGV